MGHHTTKLESHPNYSRLMHRSETFRLIVEHLNRFENFDIVETGTSRIKDNWEGDGQSTLIWDWYLQDKPTCRAFSVDIDPSACEVARSQVTRVGVFCSDSLKFLTEYSVHADRCKLLYLDSFDWSPEINLDSAYHHMAELACIWAKLSSGCMVVVDDRHGDLAGKHFMVQFFMEKLGIQPAFVGYQIGWIKP